MDVISIFEGGPAKVAAVVIYLSLSAFEISYAIRKRLKLFETHDTVLNLSLGVMTFGSKILVKGITLSFFLLVQQHWAIARIPTDSLLGLIALLFLNDLIFYWYHRLSHECRLFWAIHVTHHSSQKFNLSTAVRGNFIHFWYRFVFWAPLIILGFDPLLVLVVDEIAFFYQFWIHTEAIHKIPRWMEFLFNTPSHHRVHHGSNKVYLDKNYGAIFIVWDRVFSTFEPERETVRYGLTKNLEQQNTMTVLTHELRAIWTDVRNARNFREGWRYVFGLPGWRPEDLSESPKKDYPVKKWSGMA